MGKEVKSYLFGIDVKDENSYGFKLDVYEKEIVITQPEDYYHGAFVNIPIKEWEELKTFIDNELKNI